MKNETEASPKRGRPAGLGLWGRPAQPVFESVWPPLRPVASSALNSSHLIQLEASIQPKLDENLGQRPEGDDGRRKSSKLSRIWLRPSLAAMASLRGCVMVEFMN